MFKENRQEREEIGRLYRSLKAESNGEIEVTLLDPRNFFAIVLYFVHYVKNGQISVSKALSNLVFKNNRGAVFLNGRFISNCTDSNIEEVFNAVMEGVVHDGS
ncbi:hypothetical protein [Pseudalkalibacillus caeni]|uniref:Uncharacterized protein n=1 Tax=Exobacillus caeni TaxID=2574798 RepID=A0A5R9F4J3_9BACL|nr:hypothetical protein [Pseudalkalibacillus caeni]TLS38447.1 hypothetical protein FCL54_04730 [Pseudalkalibacillus caeni]